MTRTLMAIALLPCGVSAALLAQQSSLPSKSGQVFVVDDFQSKVTQFDLGFNDFAGNTGGVESVEGLTSISLREEGNGNLAMQVDFDFTGHENDNPPPFAGYFLSLFGLTDTLVSLSGDGQQPAQSTPFPGYFLDTQDIYGDLQAFPDLSLEQLRFDVRLESAQPVTLKIEFKDEADCQVATRQTFSLIGSWQTVSLQLPTDFESQGFCAFDWRRVSLLALIAEKHNLAEMVDNPVTGQFLLDNIVLVDWDGEYSDLDSPLLLAPAGGLDPQFEEAFLDHVRATSVLYFLDFASTDLRTGGIVQDRSPFADLMTLGGVGFQLTAYVIASQRGYLSRSQATQLVRDILFVLDTHPQGAGRVGAIGYRGFFYHFLGIDGLRKQNFDFTATAGVNEAFNTVELSSIDTALAIAGVVTAGRYFNGDSALEEEIRNRADSIYSRVEWPFMVDPLTNQFYLGWKPLEARDDSFGRFRLLDPDGLGEFSSKQEGGSEVAATLDFYTDEAILLALLAMGSPNPDFRLGVEVWDALIRDLDGGSFVKTFPGSLFTYQFSSAWLDTGSLGLDAHPTNPVNFFDNTLAAIQASRDYAIANPEGRATWAGGEGARRWGTSAAEGPFDNYFAHAAPPAALADHGEILWEGLIELEGEDGQGDGSVMIRGNASGTRTVQLDAGESRHFSIEVPVQADFSVLVRYSNDNFGPLELVEVLLDGQAVGGFQAQDTGDFGNGWNIFVTTDPPLGPVSLGPGAHQLTLQVSGGDGFGVEIDLVQLEATPFARPLETGTVTVYGAASSIVHSPQIAIDAMWEAAQLGLLHPRIGFADAYNLEILDAFLPGFQGLRTSGSWANFTGFAIDHGPMLILIDNYLHDNFVPNLFMSHPQIRSALQTVFPDWPGISAADLQVSQDESADPVSLGGLIQYRLSVSNRGPDAAHNLVLEDVLPPGSAFLSATGPEWACSHSQGHLTCNRSSLSPFQNTLITLKLRAPQTVGAVVNAASVSADSFDPSPDNNSQSEMTQVRMSRPTLLIGDFDGDGRDGMAGLGCDGRIFTTDDLTQWTQIPGTLDSLVVGDFDGDGDDDLAGLTSDGRVFTSVNLATWTQIAGSFSKLAGGDFDGDGEEDLAALDSMGNVFYSLDLQSWIQIPGTLRQLLAGDFDQDGKDDLAGLAPDGRVFYTLDLQSWIQIAGTLDVLISWDSDGLGTDDLAGLTSDGRIFLSTNLSNWTQVAGTLSSLSHADIDGDGTDNLVGLALDGRVFYSPDNNSWTLVAGNLARLAGVPNRPGSQRSRLSGDTHDDLAGLAVDGRVFFSTDTATWTQVAGVICPH